MSDGLRRDKLRNIPTRPKKVTAIKPAFREPAAPHVPRSRRDQPDRAAVHLQEKQTLAAPNKRPRNLSRGQASDQVPRSLDFATQESSGYEPGCSLQRRRRGWTRQRLPRRLGHDLGHYLIREYRLPFLRFRSPGPPHSTATPSTLRNRRRRSGNTSTTPVQLNRSDPSTTDTKLGSVSANSRNHLTTKSRRAAVYVPASSSTSSVLESIREAHRLKTAGAPGTHSSFSSRCPGDSIEIEMTRSKPCGNDYSSVKM